MLIGQTVGKSQANDLKPIDRRLWLGPAVTNDANFDAMATSMGLKSQAMFESIKPLCKMIRF